MASERGPFSFGRYPVLETQLSGLLAWLSPIVAAILITAGQTLVALGQRRLNMRMDEGERKRDEARAETEAKHRAEAEWRDCIERQMAEQDKRIGTILAAQCTQMRSDLIHRSHRYLDDLGCASTDEKESFNAEYEDYTEICEANGIENHFVDNLARRVMALPERDI